MKREPRLTQYNTLCKQALLNYEQGIKQCDILERVVFNISWVRVFTTLFCSVSTRPGSLPPLVSCRFYKCSKIREFHKLFNETREGLLSDNDLKPEKVYKKITSSDLIILKNN